jgi:hypothetical protein
MLVLPQSNDQDTQGLSGAKVVGRALSAAIVLDDIEAHLLAFGQSAQTGPLDGRDMDENVRPAVVGLDEAEAFGRIEELYSSDIHDDSFQSVIGVRTPRLQRCVPYRSILEEEDRQMRQGRENKVQPQDRRYEYSNGSCPKQGGICNVTFEPREDSALSLSQGAESAIESSLRAHRRYGHRPQGPRRRSAPERGIRVICAYPISAEYEMLRHNSPQP